MRWAWLLALVAAGVLLVWLGSRPPSSPPGPPSSPDTKVVDHAEFVGSARCAACHEGEHSPWHGSGHARALGEPSAATGAFDGKPVGEATPLTEDGVPVVRVDARGGRAPGHHRVTWVVGGTNELYLFTDARGAWRVLPIAWSGASTAWEPAGDVLSGLWGPFQGDPRQVVFNRDCAMCHATRFDPGFRPEGQAEVFFSKVAEPGVGCEACHGPGSVHARWHEEKRAGAYEAPAKLTRGGPGGCIVCHGVHEFLFALPDDPAVPAAELAVSRDFDGPGFFADGRRSVVHGEGAAFAGSRCAKGGATCLSCHPPHGDAQPVGDAPCTRCHDGFARKEHTFHDGVSCLDCHMPRLFAAPFGFCRDHAIRGPEPALTERFGIPNACGVCHADKTAAWTREAKEKWYGPADGRVVRDVALVADLRNGEVAKERLEEVARDPRSPLFSRATALRALPWGDPAVRDALGSDDVALLQIACGILAERPDPEAAPALLRLLGHQARTVRVEAAYALVSAGWRPSDPPPWLRDDAREMVVRQYAATPLLLRAAWILDAVGASGEMAYLLPTIAQRAPRDAAPLMIKRGRALAEAGQHDKALLAYDDARKILGDATPAVLFVDTADSLAATGEVKAAETIWRGAIEHLDPAGVERAIAQARLLGVEGRGEEGRAILVPIAARLEDDPVGGDTLLRVRWSIRALTPR
ncbi:MAG TPA: multiheme c-type cytochrome [Planctomycetota bacterium]|nr:multiheme c-type cytochrome [Planctomycetota bacterium]